MNQFVEGRYASPLCGSWWCLLLRGLAAIAFGVLAFIQPGISLSALVLLYGAYSLVDGGFAVWAAIAGRKQHSQWWLLLLEGLLSIGIGVMTIFVPGITAVALVFYIATREILTGILEIVAAIRLRKEIEGEWLLILSGILSVAFGFFLAIRPGEGAIALVWIIATYAIVFGAMLVMLALKARGFTNRLQTA